MSDILMGMPEKEWFMEQFEALGASMKRALDESEESRREMEGRIDARFERIVERFDSVDSDLRDLKRTSSQLVQSQGEGDHKSIEHEHRIHRIEKHLDLAI